MSSGDIRVFSPYPPAPPSPKGEGGIVVFRRGALRAPLHSLRPNPPFNL